MGGPSNETQLVQHVATSRYDIDQAPRRAFERKMGVAGLLTVLADGDQKTHGAVWNHQRFAKPGETVWQIMEGDRQVSDAGARHYAPLDTLAAMPAKLSQNTRRRLKGRSRRCIETSP